MRQPSATFLDELDGVRAGYFTAPGPTTTEIRCGLDRQDALLMVDAWAVIGGKREAAGAARPLGLGTKVALRRMAGKWAT